MNDEKRREEQRRYKVMGELIEIARQESSSMDEWASIARAESLLAKLQEDGVAWYPTWDQLIQRTAATGATWDRFTSDACIRAAIDLYRERELIVSQPTVKDCLTVGHPAYEPDQSTTDKWESGELGRSLEHAEVSAVRQAARVGADPVAWRFCNPNGSFSKWFNWPPPASVADPQFTIKTEYAYSAQPTVSVPDGVMLAMEHVADWLEGDHLSSMDADHVLNWLRTLSPAAVGGSS